MCTRQLQPGRKDTKKEEKRKRKSKKQFENRLLCNVDLLVIWKAACLSRRASLSFTRAPSYRSHLPKHFLICCCLVRFFTYFAGCSNFRISSWLFLSNLLQNIVYTQCCASCIKYAISKYIQLMYLLQPTKPWIATVHRRACFY